jgi:hypothetical protein
VSRMLWPGMAEPAVAESSSRWIGATSCTVERGTLGATTGPAEVPCGAVPPSPASTALVHEAGFSPAHGVRPSGVEATPGVGATGVLPHAAPVPELGHG